CHQVGNLPPKQKNAPSLNLTRDRLRPDWLERWIASPQRLLIYPTGNNPMPQNFPKGSTEYPEFHGPALEKAKAVADILMIFPEVADMPEDRKLPAPQGAPK